MSALNKVFDVPTRQNQMTVQFVSGGQNPMNVKLVHPYAFRACVGISIKMVMGQCPGNSFAAGDALLVKSTRLSSLANHSDITLSNVLPGSTDVSSSNIIAYAPLETSGSVIDPKHYDSPTLFWNPTTMDSFDLSLVNARTGAVLVTTDPNFWVSVFFVVHTLLEVVQQ